MTVYVTLLVYLRPDEEERFENTYREVSAKLRGRIPGQLHDELLRPLSPESPYILLSQWQDLAAYQAWTQTEAHRRDVAPLRQHWLYTESKEYVLVNDAITT